MYEVRTESFTPRHRTRPGSPITFQRSPSPVAIRRVPSVSNELQNLKKENDILDAELQKLRTEYQNLEASNNRDAGNKLMQERLEKERILASLNEEIQSIDKTIIEVKERAQMSPSRHKEIRERSDLENNLEILKREERCLKTRKAVKVEHRKDEIKTSTKRELASMNVQKRLIESDIQAFGSTIEKLRTILGHQCMSPRSSAKSGLGTPRSAAKSYRSTPTKHAQLHDRITAVNQEVSSLEHKCRALQHFVAIRSPERFRKIINTSECVDDFSILRV